MHAINIRNLFLAEVKTAVPTKEQVLIASWLSYFLLLTTLASTY
jgi:hypothetical protein